MSTILERLVTGVKESYWGKVEMSFGKLILFLYMLKRNCVSISICLSLTKCHLFSYMVLISETLCLYPGMIGHLAYPLSFFQSISLYSVYHMAESEGRPDLEESLNFHYHVSLYMNLQTSSHYEEGEVFPAIM